MYRRALAGGLLAAALVLPFAAAPARAAAPPSGVVDLLTYNVAGLPELINSAALPRAPKTRIIGTRVSPFTVVNVQEDFNFHADLYATDTHPYRTPTSGGAGIGSGLNTMSSLPFDADDFERVRWNSCQIDSGDCLTPKGFTFTRLQLAPDIWVDLYNLHTNAGTSSGDFSSRADNLAQLAAFIGTHSAGNAVIVMGDTNTRYTRAEDTIRTFAAANGLTDAWVQLVRGGVAPAAGSATLGCDAVAPTNGCETVDKVLYRSGPLVTFTPVSYANKAADFLDGGVPLSDHSPIAVRLAWQRNADLATTDQFGGPHGDYFSDLTRVTTASRATTISMRSGSRVDQVGVRLASGAVITHGGTGGTARSLTLGSGEYVASVTLCQGQVSGRTRIFYASFRTSAGRTLSGGSTTSACVTRTAPAGFGIVAFTGRSGAEVDKLGFVLTRVP